MAEHHERQRQRHYPTPMDTTKTRFQQNGGHSSSSKVLAVLTLFPIGGFCLVVAALTLTGTLIGLIVATPLFVIFSPILVLGMLTIGLAVTGFLTSGALGVTALSSLTYLVNCFRRIRGDGRGWSVQDYARRRARGTA